MIEVNIFIEGVMIDEFFKSFGFISREEIISYVVNELKRGYVYTHNGKEFHADEVFGLALLDIFRKSYNEKKGKEILPAFKVIRERGIKNVGLKIDVDETVFDHHFPKNKAAFRKNGIQYATAGLLWYVLGPELVPERFVETIDFSIFQKIDACDNGQELESQYSDMVSSFNLFWNEENITLESQMQKAIDFATIILERKIKEYNSIELAKEFVRSSYENAKDKRIIVLQKAMNWQEVLVPTEAIFVIWQNDKEWCCQAVPIAVGSFELKKGFNPNWRGFRNEQLQEISGLDLIFCHSTGFYLVAKTKEAAIAACNQSL